MKDWAIIFDVDGVLLELTRDEEELFFEPFAKYIDASKLSRDWNSYKIRNDEDIVNEIVATHGLPVGCAAKIKAEYLKKLRATKIISQPISGVAQLFEQIAPLAELGIATANFREAAKLRLRQSGLWEPVKRFAFGADGGGAKSQILARIIAALKLPTKQIIFIGDNINDVEAGLQNNVHFIGFSCDAKRLELLTKAGAKVCANSHEETVRIIFNTMKQIKIGGTNGQP